MAQHPDGDNPADLDEMDDEEGFAFSPVERRVVTQPLDLSVQTLFEQWNEKLLILPQTQREYVWDNGKASRLIESLLLNIPIPVIYFAETREAKYEIFDGHQRIRSIVRFLNNEFALNGLSVLREFKGAKFFQLPDREQRFLRMRTMRTILISIESHPNMKFEIYERLNTGSIMLNAQELRKSIYRGDLHQLLSNLAKEPEFRNLIGTKVPRKRLVDEELILRFFAMRESLPLYRAPLKRFLNEFMAHQSRSNEIKIADLGALFLGTVRYINFYLGNSAFRVLDVSARPSEPFVNRALFEAQMLAFSWVEERPDHKFINSVKHEISRLFTSEVFVDSIQRATGDKSRTYTRVRETAAALERAGLQVRLPYSLAR